MTGSAKGSAGLTDMEVHVMHVKRFHLGVRDVNALAEAHWSIAFPDNTKDEHVVVKRGTCPAVGTRWTNNERSSSKNSGCDSGNTSEAQFHFFSLELAKAQLASAQQRSSENGSDR
jgi:hypothetical protein